MAKKTPSGASPSQAPKESASNRADTDTPSRDDVRAQDQMESLAAADSGKKSLADALEAGSGKAPVTDIERKLPPRKSQSGSYGASRTSAAEQLAPEMDHDTDLELGHAEPQHAEPEPASASKPKPSQPRPAAPSRSNIAANDQVPSIGGLIYALNQKPSRRIFTYAIGASAIWLGLSALLGGPALFSEYGQAGSIAQLITRPTFMTLLGVIIVPVAMIWAFAMITWRSQELHLMSNAMTEVAVRLAEPDRLAEDAVASLGQSVRRQANAMNDAVARALGRAGELDAMLQTEVAALERSYSDNEHRIRSLISELASEREALSNNSARVRSELEGVGSRVTQELSEATNQIASSLEARGQAVDKQIRSAAETVNQQIAKNSNEAAALLSNSGNALMSSLSAVNQKITIEVPNLLTKLSESQNNLGNVITGANETLGALEGKLRSQTEALETTLGNRSKELQGLLRDYTHTFDTTLAKKTKEISESLHVHFDTFDKVFSGKAKHLDESIRANAERIEDSITNRSAALDQALVERTKAIDEAFAQRIESIEQSIIDGTARLDQSVGEKADTLRNAMAEHATALTTSLDSQTNDLQETLGKGIEAVRESSENISEQSIRTIETLATQAQQLRSVSADVLNQIADLTNSFQGQSASILQAAHALETSNFKIDSVLEARHGELATLLERISSKAQDFDSHLRDYSDTLNTSLSEAELRAREVQLQLQEGTQASSQAALQELERLRNDTQFQAEQTLNDLRSRFTNVTREVTDQLTTLKSRVSDTTDTVHQRTNIAASDIEQTQATLRARAEAAAREIRETRQALQEQVKGLPESARQSAHTMRTALQEQLRALDALTILAHDQAGKRDITPPAPQQQTSTHASLPAPQQQQQAPIKPQAAQNQMAAPQARVSLTNQYQNRQAETQRATAQSETAAINAVANSLVSQMTEAQNVQAAAGGHAQPPANVQQTAAPQPPAVEHRAQTPSATENMPAQPEPGRSGWSLGDLLARASLDEEEGTRSASGQQVPAFNVNDVASAMDANTAALIWNRFRSGERGVLDRGLYTPQGQATFDQIAHRLKIDQSFANAVNRYLLDFERMLKEADRQDADGRLLQHHLLSETGRVYLMLAHASGRLS